MADISTLWSELADNPLVWGLRSYLASRNAVPPIVQGRTEDSEASGEFSYDPWKRNDVGRIVLGNSADSATLAHELTHAAVNQMVGQYYDMKAGKSPVNQQFMDAYEKLYQGGMIRAGDPQTLGVPNQWQAENSAYRASENEAPAWAVGNSTQFGTPRDYQQWRAPGHLDATLATQMAILADIAKRAQETPTK